MERVSAFAKDAAEREDAAGSLSLKNFSKAVWQKVLARRTTDYSSVADEMLHEITCEADAVARERAAVAMADGRVQEARAIMQAAGNQYEERNVRRRVYDALNVLMAAGIISKDRLNRTIAWKGLPARPRDELDHLEVGCLCCCYTRVCA